MRRPSDHALPEPPAAPGADRAPDALAVLALLTEGVIVADASGRIIYVNEAASRLHGVAALDVPVEGYTDTYHLFTEAGAPYPPDALPLARAVRSGEWVADARWRIRRPDGSEVVAVGSARPLLAPDGSQVGALLTMRDDTARVAAERAERRAARLLAQMSDAHVAFDRDFRIVSVNPAAERALGRAADTLLGRSAWEAFPAAHGSEIERRYRRVQTTGQEAHFVHRYVGEGYDFHVEIDAYATEERGVAMFWRDVTERVRASEERERLLEAERAARARIEVAESRLRDVVEQAPVAVAVLEGPEHVYTLVSPMYAASPGAGRPLVGRTVREAFPEIAEQGIFELMDRVYQTGVPFAEPERLVYIDRGGPAPEPGWFDVGYQPLRDATGRVYAIASVTYDVTEHVLARREVEVAREAAERARVEAEGANRAKSQFLAVMSHELRTPLNAIGGYAELLELGIRGPVTAQQTEDLRRIQTSQRHLLGLINEVLNYARLETGSVRYDLEDVAVREALAAGEALVSPQARAKGLALTVADVAPTLTARADAEKLRQILVNLLSNAVKFTDRGGAVSLDAAADGETVQLRVRDTGIGIPSDKLAVIFEPFVQVRADLTRTAEGAGLGLAISRDLARGMGGELVVERSTLGAGTTLLLTLPIAARPMDDAAPG